MTDPYYDIAGDWELIEASFQSMYGMRLAKELAGMKWREFAALLSGLDEKTPLGRVAAIRSENDPERLRQFTPAMRRLRAEWRTRQARKMPPRDVAAFLEDMKQAFLAM